LVFFYFFLGFLPVTEATGKKNNWRE